MRWTTIYGLASHEWPWPEARWKQYYNVGVKWSVWYFPYLWNQWYLLYLTKFRDGKYNKKLKHSDRWDECARCSNQWLWFRLYKNTLQCLHHICTNESTYHIKLKKIQNIRLTCIHLDSCCNVSAIYSFYVCACSVNFPFVLKNELLNFNRHTRYC